MKFSVTRDSLSGALQLVGRAVSTRGALPSLGGILVAATDGALTMRATDNELALTSTLSDAKLEQEGTVLLPGRLFADVVRSLPPGEVSVELRSEQRDVEIAGGSARFHLRTLPADDFPRLPELEGEVAKLPAAPLAATIDLVARAASRDEVRPILTGVLLQAEGNTLTMVATDSYRLSVKHTQLDGPVSQTLEANVPAKALRELARIIAASGADEVEISLPRNQAVFSVAGVILSSRLIEGQFPSWRQLIPEAFEHDVHLPREEFLEIAKRISQLAQRNAPLRLAFSEGELTVAAETPDIGDASEAMPAPYSGEPLEIAFNPQFLVEGAESVATEQVAIQLSSPLRPGLLRPVDGDDFSLPRDADPPQRLRGRGRVVVESLSTLSFRNLATAQISLGPGINLLWGPNGAGKTNLLEALYTALAGRSCRTRDARETIAFGESLMRVEAVVAEADQRRAFLSSVSRADGRRHLVDGAPTEAAGSALRPALAVFMPDRLALVKGPPAGRRAHLDGFCAALWPARDEARRRYSRALAQRNALLGRIRSAAASPAGLDAWDLELAIAGVELAAVRAAAVERLATPFAEASSALGLGPPATLRYRPRSEATGAEQLVAELAERRDTDVARGYSGWGPHHDELAIESGDRSLRRYGSQGQQRTALLALLFAERRALLDDGRPPPLMLLDDVSSELDAERRRLLVEHLGAGGGQAVVTATEPDHLPATVSRREIAIRDGRALADAAGERAA